MVVVVACVRGERGWWSHVGRRREGWRAVLVVREGGLSSS